MYIGPYIIDYYLIAHLYMTSCHIRKCNSDNKEEGLNKAYSFPRTW
jgi:hypothetical protein